MSNGRHGREQFFIDGRIRSMSADGRTIDRPATTDELATEFKFARLVPDLPAVPNSLELLSELSVAMTHHQGGGAVVDQTMPAGYTYLGQFVDHDLVLDPSELDLERTTIPDLRSMRSPTLDLDSLYGHGPAKQLEYYQDDGVSLLEGETEDVTPGKNASANGGRGFDLPRWGDARGGKRKTIREARIPDIRNDENLAVGQLHAAFIRLHNKVARQQKGKVPPARLFEHVRAIVTKHYQFMLKTDYLPRIVDKAIVEDVFANGRRIFDPGSSDPQASMPVEFTGAAFRLGHSMIRTSYEWNAIFNSTKEPGVIEPGHLFRLFRFSGTSGSLVPGRHPAGSRLDLNELDEIVEPAPRFGRKLVSNWVADWTRLFDFSAFGFVPPQHDIPQFNFANRIDPHLVDPLTMLPLGSVGVDSAISRKRNLAFRNLIRGRMLGLPSGQQLARHFVEQGVDVTPLSAEQIVQGLDVVRLTDAEMRPENRQELADNTPLWFYVLREAEFNGGKMTGVGGRIVAETFHRAMQASRNTILGATPFEVEIGPGAGDNRCNMEDLLHYAFDSDPTLLNPL